MRKDFGSKPYLFPMPVLMIATYNEDGSVDVMNMAWGGICDTDKVALNISEGHKTSQNIIARRAFTVSVADVAHVDEADYLGIASGNKVADKFERSGLTAVKSEFVDAPVIQEFPVAIECEAIELHKCEWGFRVVGRIVNASADEAVLAEDGKPDVARMNVIAFDQFRNGYYVIGEHVADAWNAGKRFME